jgi:hypothetical protein
MRGSHVLKVSLEVIHGLYRLRVWFGGSDWHAVGTNLGLEPNAHENSLLDGTQADVQAMGKPQLSHYAVKGEYM